jgi:hypothetical protein
MAVQPSGAATMEDAPSPNRGRGFQIRGDTGRRRHAAAQPSGAAITMSGGSCVSAIESADFRSPVP